MKEEALSSPHPCRMENRAMYQMESPRTLQVTKPNVQRP